MLEMIVGAVLVVVGLFIGAVFGQGFGEAKAYRGMLAEFKSGTPPTDIGSKGDLLQ